MTVSRVIQAMGSVGMTATNGPDHLPAYGDTFYWPPHSRKVTLTRGCHKPMVGMEDHHHQLRWLTATAGLQLCSSQWPIISLTHSSVSLLQTAGQMVLITSAISPVSGRQEGYLVRGGEEVTEFRELEGWLGGASNASHYAYCDKKL